MSDAHVPEFLKVKELCQRLRISRSTADKMIKDGTISSLRVGGIIRIPTSAVEEFISRQTGRAS